MDSSCRILSKSSNPFHYNLNNPKDILKEISQHCKQIRSIKVELSVREVNENIKFIMFNGSIGVQLGLRYLLNSNY